MTEDPHTEPKNNTVDLYEYNDLQHIETPDKLGTGYAINQAGKAVEEEPDDVKGEMAKPGKEKPGVQNASAQTNGAQAKANQGSGNRGTGDQSTGYDTFKDNYTDVLPCKHEYMKETVIAPTCTKDGVTIYECTDCGDYSYSGNKIAPLGHSWDAGKITKEATCRAAGSIVYTCATCGLQRTESIPAKPHSYVDTTVEPTLSEKGYVEHVCSVCGSSYRDSYTDPLPHEHSYNQRTVDATCEQSGYTEFTCTICGYSYRGNEIGALGHNYSSTVIDPQVGVGGYTHHVCSRCGASYDDSYTNALPQPAQYSAVEAANYGNAFLSAMGIPLRSYEFSACRQMVTNYDPSFFGYTQDGLNDLMEQLVINNIAAAYSEPGITIGTDPGQLETVVAYCFGTDNPDGTIDLSCWYGYDGYHTADGQTLWH